MKINSNILALCFLQVLGASAFFVSTPKTSAVAPLHSAPLEKSSKNLELFPLNILPSDRIEGGGTLRTYKMPPYAERAELVFKTKGRPMKAHVELWLGPIRRVHNLEIMSENGNLTPLRVLLKFKKLAPTLKISAAGDVELPLDVGVSVPLPERSEALGANTEMVWNASPKTLIQGGPVEGGKGAIRSFPIAPEVESVQLLVWSKDVGKKSFKLLIEVLQGPNNRKQTLDLQCGGGSQPYHAVIATPGNDVTVRIQNKKFVEDGLTQVVLVPYEVANTKPDDDGWSSGGSSSGWWK